MGTEMRARDGLAPSKNSDLRSLTRGAAKAVPLRRIIKRAVQGVFLVLVFPVALLCAFGRANSLYVTLAQLFSLFPGLVGIYLRAALYKYTLRECSIDTSIAFGSFFSSRHACIGEYVSIGSFCIVGRARIGARTQIASHVEIPSGRHQHHHDEQGRVLDREFQEVEIGSDCWIGASAVILANVGPGSTIGAGSVVVNEIPPRVVAAGVPARPIRAGADRRATVEPTT